MSWLRAFGREALDLLLPATCPGCGDGLVGGGDRGLCAACAAALLPLAAPLCERCGVQRPGGEDGPCAACLVRPPDYDRARAWGAYAGVLVELVQALKYQGRRAVAPLLADLLVEAGRAALDLSSYDRVVPVPLHRARALERGFNQAALLARPLSRWAPVCRDLERVVPTRSQVGLAPEARRDNVSSAFALGARAAGRYRGAAVLLVDDVVTTGATGSACARILKEAGAVRVDLLSVARAEPHDAR